MKKLYLQIMIVIIIFIVISCEQLPSDDNIHIIKSSYPIELMDIANINENFEEFEFVKKDWQEHKEIIEDDWNYDRISWDVSLRDDKIIVSTELYYKRFRFDLDNGYFISENIGEFGGKIDFVDNDGTIYTIVSDCNPIYMFSINDDIYILEGLFHISLVRGNIYKLNNVDGKWEVEKIIDLGGIPRAYTIDKNNVYIFTTVKVDENDNGYYCISKILKLTISEEDIEIHPVTETSLLFSNSMVKKGNELYIGAKGGLAIVNLNNNKIKFYTKK